MIAGGLATPALLAQVLTAKYCDHTPLYRQSRIFARHGIDLARSTLAGWVGGACWWLDALHDRLRKDVLASNHLFADGEARARHGSRAAPNPVPVHDPGNGRTKTGRIWVYARDQRGWAGDAPPAAVYIFAPDRRAERPAAHLGAYRGVLHVDGYAGFERLTRGGTITLAACWAHTRRKFHDVFQSTGSPIAEEALERIRDIYLVEAGIRGQPPPFRLAARRQHARPLVDDLRLRLDRQLRQVPGRSGLAEAIRYAIARWAGLKRPVGPSSAFVRSTGSNDRSATGSRSLDDVCVELDTNPVERAIRPVALGRKNHRFVGSDGGGHRWAVICSRNETCKLNGVDPSAYLTDVLQRRINGHPASRFGDLLP